MKLHTLHTHKKIVKMSLSLSILLHVILYMFCLDWCTIGWTIIEIHSINYQRAKKKTKNNPKSSIELLINYRKEILKNAFGKAVSEHDFQRSCPKQATPHCRQRHEAKQPDLLDEAFLCHEAKQPDLLDEAFLCHEAKQPDLLDKAFLWSPTP